jgi:hypothetical protein
MGGLLDRRGALFVAALEIWVFAVGAIAVD